ncbi:hypothetical protein QYE76_047156 [Lolium multiflorum]|uniref:Retrotransposon Copia-like N-terminal domain-containing protein n=1 Tax=Lolium multiflorum TaxID=4521 RepID=A0AAD8TQY3_LOLMU|nr:hypothetical protein QYE76_047152 [Lolium multiflorum]KAK1686308.1 hypothetical protein QYE76_047156 [Lolium multiflorum]
MKGTSGTMEGFLLRLLACCLDGEDHDSTRGAGRPVLHSLRASSSETHLDRDRAATHVASSSTSCLLHRRNTVDAISSSSSSSSAATLNITLSEKLTRDNFLLWQTQVLPEIRGAQLFGYLDGSYAEPEKELQTKDKDGVEVKIPNPEHAR